MIRYVDCTAAYPGDGSRLHPFKTISQAAAVAMPGDEVLVAPGVYREEVSPRWAGTRLAPIVYRSAEPRAAVITGAEGGFAAEEAEMAAKAGAKTVGLGPRILRCETAPLAVLSAVMTLTGNLE